MADDPVIERLVELDSTNAELSRRLAGGENPREGHWIVADRQTAGRGRLGRDWLDGRGNFMGSTLVLCDETDPPPQTLALVAGVALHACLSQQLAKPARLMLKWPNDVLLDGAKLAGILLERIGDAVVIGIGVNLAVAPDVAGRKVTSLAAHGVKTFRDRFAFDLAMATGEAIAAWRNDGLAATIERWSRHGPARGAPIRVDLSESERVEGTFAGLDGDGALRIRLEDGSSRAIHAGEVSLLGGDEGV